MRTKLFTIFLVTLVTLAATNVSLAQDAVPQPVIDACVNQPADMVATFNGVSYHCGETRVDVVLSTPTPQVVTQPIETAAQGYPDGLVEFCRSNQNSSVRHRASGVSYNCAEVLGGEFEVVDEPFEVVDQLVEGQWNVVYYDGATEQMHGWFDELRAPAPELWPAFPNVDNSQANFVAANGLEYGLDESVFMEQNEMGNFPVQARGYRLISGDYNIPGIDECEADTAEAGCAIAIFNVGEVTADIEGWVRQGFTVPGRYWNGDELDQAMWGLSSHVSANMLNYPTTGAGTDTLNNPMRTNAGANCSVPSACERVRFTIAITSGNELLVLAQTYVGADDATQG